MAISRHLFSQAAGKKTMRLYPPNLLLAKALQVKRQACVSGLERGDPSVLLLRSIFILRRFRTPSALRVSSKFLPSVPAADSDLLSVA